MLLSASLPSTPPLLQKFYWLLLPSHSGPICRIDCVEMQSEAPQQTSTASKFNQTSPPATGQAMIAPPKRGTNAFMCCEEKHRRSQLLLANPAIGQKRWRQQNVQEVTLALTSSLHSKYGRWRLLLLHKHVWLSHL